MNATKAINEMVSNLKIYHKIGTDTEGRTHHYCPKTHEIVVCRADRDGAGIRDEDIETTITPPEGSTGAWDYIQFVRDEVDGLDWTETNMPETEPEGR